MKKTLLKNKSSDGYAIIFSVVIIGVIVVVTLAISALVQRGLELSSIGQQSMEAFFAADAGVECVLLYDIHERSEGVLSSDYFPRPLVSVVNRVMSCGATSVRAQPYMVGGSQRGYTFQIQGNDDDRYCADVVVLINGNDTSIRSTGYNTCNTSDLGRIERGLEVHY